MLVLKIYESITAYIYRELGRKFGFKILGHGSNCIELGKSGVKHQIDVLTSHPEGKKHLNWPSNASTGKKKGTKTP